MEIGGQVDVYVAPNRQAAETKIDHERTQKGDKFFVVIAFFVKSHLEEIADFQF